MGIQALVTEGSVEAFDKRIVGRLARAGEVDLHSVPIGPQIHSLTGELAAVVAEQHLRHTTLLLQPAQHPHYIFSFQALADFDG